MLYDVSRDEQTDKSLQLLLKRGYRGLISIQAAVWDLGGGGNNDSLRRREHNEKDKDIVDKKTHQKTFSESL